MNKKVCDCRGSRCHTAPGAKLYLVHLPSRVGGKGTHVMKSEECLPSALKGGGKVVDEVPML